MPKLDDLLNTLNKATAPEPPKPAQVTEELATLESQLKASTDAGTNPNPPEAAEALPGALLPPQEAVTAVATPKAKRKRRTKAEMEAARNGTEATEKPATVTEVDENEDPTTFEAKVISARADLDGGRYEVLLQMSDVSEIRVGGIVKVEVE